MQLLECLAHGYTEITESDVMSECAAIWGYLECMDDLMGNGVVTESLVMEGFDVKGIVGTMVKFVKSIIKRIGDMLAKAGRFIMGKARALKAKFSKKKSSESSSSEDGGESKTADDKDEKDAAGTGSESTSKDNSGDSHAAGSKESAPQKTKEEMITDIVKNSNYPCMFPGYASNALSTMTSLIEQVMSGSRRLFGDAVGTMYKLAVEGIEPSKREAKRTDRDLDDFMQIAGDEKVMIARILNIEDGGYEDLMGKVSSRSDLKNIPSIVFKASDKGGTSIKDKEQYDHYRDRLAALENNCVTYAKYANDHFEKTSAYLKKNTTQLDRIEKKGETAGEVNDYARQVFGAIKKAVELATACLTDMTSGSTSVYQQIEADIVKGHGFFDAMDAKIKQAGIEI